MEGLLVDSDPESRSHLRQLLSEQLACRLADVPTSSIACEVLAKKNANLRLLLCADSLITADLEKIADFLTSSPYHHDLVWIAVRRQQEGTSRYLPWAHRLRTIPRLDAELERPFHMRALYWIFRLAYRKRLQALNTLWVLGNADAESQQVQQYCHRNSVPWKQVEHITLDRLRRRHLPTTPPSLVLVAPSFFYAADDTGTAFRALLRAPFPYFTVIACGSCNPHQVLPHLRSAHTYFEWPTKPRHWKMLFQRCQNIAESRIPLAQSLVVSGIWQRWPWNIRPVVYHFVQQFPAAAQYQIELSQWYREHYALSRALASLKQACAINPFYPLVHLKILEIFQLQNAHDHYNQALKAAQYFCPGHAYIRSLPLR